MQRLPSFVFFYFHCLELGGLSLGSTTLAYRFASGYVDMIRCHEIYHHLVASEDSTEPFV